MSKKYDNLFTKASNIMTTLTSITDILQGEVYLTDLHYGENLNCELFVGDYLIMCNIQVDGYMVKADYECNMPAYFELTNQEIEVISIIDEDGQIELSKSDLDVIDAWFNQIKLEVNDN